MSALYSCGRRSTRPSCPRCTGPLHRTPETACSTARAALEAAGGGVKPAKIPDRARNDADNRRLWEASEQLTGVTFPKPN